MKTRSLNFVFVLMLFVCVVSCASRRQDYLKIEDVPAVTPYHTNDVIEGAYRFEYVQGFDDFMSLHADEKDRLMMGVPPEAERAGYLAGVSAAYDAWDAKWRAFWQANLNSSTNQPKR